MAVDRWWRGGKVRLESLIRAIKAKICSEKSSMRIAHEGSFFLTAMYGKRFVLKNLSLRGSMAGQTGTSSAYKFIERQYLVEYTTDFRPYVCTGAAWETSAPCHQRECVPWSTSRSRRRSEQQASTSYMG